MTYRNIIFFIADRQFGRKALFMNIYVYEHKKKLIHQKTYFTNEKMGNFNSQGYLPN